MGRVMNIRDVYFKKKYMPGVKLCQTGEIRRRVFKKIAFEAPINVWIKMLSNDRQQMYIELIKHATMAPLPQITDVSFSGQTHPTAWLTRSSWAPTISWHSLRKVGLHTGARVNFVLVTYLLSFCFVDQIFDTTKSELRCSEENVVELERNMKAVGNRIKEGMAHDRCASRNITVVRPSC